MQTSGAALLASKRRSLVRALMAVHDGRSAHGLLYFAAVRGDWREHEDRRHRLANTLSKSVGRGSAKVIRVCGLGRPFQMVHAGRLRT
jgi:hypothetical protein